MEHLTWKEFCKLSPENKFLMSGHSLIVLGGSLLAFGNLLKLLKGDGLPSTTMLEKQIEPKVDTNSLYGKKKSYFNS